MYTKVTRPAVCTTQPLVRHVEMYTKVTRPAPLYHAEPLVGLRHVEMWPTRKVDKDIIMRSRDQCHVEVDMMIIITSTFT